MSLAIRPAKLRDLDAVSELLLADAEARHALDPDLWKLDQAARDKIRSTVKAAMEAAQPPFRQQWLIAEDGGKAIGVAHTILLPVPPIYAGAFGPPGLIMEDCFVVPDAPAETRRALFRAAEADLIEAGAVILLASGVEGGDWQETYAAQGYDRLTAYFAKSGLRGQTAGAKVRRATGGDIPGIVRASALHRRVLDNIHHLFWQPHEEADARFGSWMRRSLSLEDRDMFVSEDEGGIRGYAISQPATALHFPAAHDISDVGVIDDFFHDAFEDRQMRASSGPEAAALFSAAEAARAERGDRAILVVCPARWQSKISLLEQQGYRNAITWHIRILVSPA
jgi:hypothetical protein